MPGVSRQKIKHTKNTIMSYVSSFVQAQPVKIVATESKVEQTTTVTPAAKREFTKKILLFIGIMTCLVLAVII